MTYDNTNSGLLSRNDRKESEKHPDFKGSINVAGVDYWLSAWVKERKDGTGKFFSLSVQPKDAQASVATTSKPTDYKTALDDDLPF